MCGRYCGRMVSRQECGSGAATGGGGEGCGTGCVRGMGQRCRKGSCSSHASLGARASARSVSGGPSVSAALSQSRQASNGWRK
eukprot:208710-Pleurochrysis_carterae.AAC.1